MKINFSKIIKNYQESVLVFSALLFVLLLSWYLGWGVRLALRSARAPEPVEGSVEVTLRLDEAKILLDHYGIESPESP